MGNEFCVSKRKDGISFTTEEKQYLQETFRQAANSNNRIENAQLFEDLFPQLPNFSQNLFSTMCQYQGQGARYIELPTFLGFVEVLIKKTREYARFQLSEYDRLQLIAVVITSNRESRFPKLSSFISQQIDDNEARVVINEILGLLINNTTIDSDDIKEKEIIESIIQAAISQDRKDLRWGTIIQYLIEQCDCINDILIRYFEPQLIGGSFSFKIPTFVYSPGPMMSKNLLSMLTNYCIDIGQDQQIELVCSGTNYTAIEAALGKCTSTIMLLKFEENNKSYVFCFYSPARLLNNKENNQTLQLYFFMIHPEFKKYNVSNVPLNSYSFNNKDFQRSHSKNGIGFGSNRISQFILWIDEDILMDSYISWQGMIYPNLNRLSCQEGATLRDIEIYNLQGDQMRGTSSRSLMQSRGRTSNINGRDSHMLDSRAAPLKDRQFDNNTNNRPSRDLWADNPLNKPTVSRVKYEYQNTNSDYKAPYNPQPPQQPSYKNPNIQPISHSFNNDQPSIYNQLDETTKRADQILRKSQNRLNGDSNPAASPIYPDPSFVSSNPKIRALLQKFDVSFKQEDPNTPNNNSTLNNSVLSKYELNKSKEIPKSSYVSERPASVSPAQKPPMNSRPNTQIPFIEDLKQSFAPSNAGGNTTPQENHDNSFHFTPDPQSLHNDNYQYRNSAQPTNNNTNAYPYNPAPYESLPPLRNSSQDVKKQVINNRNTQGLVSQIDDSGVGSSALNESFQSIGLKDNDDIRQTYNHPQEPQRDDQYSAPKKYDSIADKYRNLASTTVQSGPKDGESIANQYRNLSTNPEKTQGRLTANDVRSKYENKRSSSFLE